MDCKRCGASNEDGATFCDRCGARLADGPAAASAGDPMSNVVASPPASSGSAQRSMERVVYNPAQRHAWWFPIGVWAILSVFFLFADVMVTHGISWSVWPVGVIGIFLVGFPLLRRLEAWSLARRGKRVR
jgi:zinc-ribbon domain